MSEKIGKGLKIFILDDEKDICFFLKEFFSKRGFEVETALTGPAALKTIKKFVPDIAILDIYLLKGEMSGIDVLKFIKETHPACYCAMVTRTDEEAIIQQTKAIGADDFLVKPLTLEKIEQAIIKMVRKIRKGGK